MTKISDKIRDFVHRSYEDEYMDPKELLAIADRIDAEMVELPRDRDGATIHVGDTVYMSNGLKVHVSRVNIARDHTSIDSGPCGNGPLFFAIEPTRFTHTRPDSLESIANELDGMVDAASHADDTCEKLSDLAGRIRKLAKEQGNE